MRTKQIAEAAEAHLNLHGIRPEQRRCPICWWVVNARASPHGFLRVGFSLMDLHWHCRPAVTWIAVVAIHSFSSRKRCEMLEQVLVPPLPTPLSRRSTAKPSHHNPTRRNSAHTRPTRLNPHCNAPTPHHSPLTPTTHILTPHHSPHLAHHNEIPYPSTESLLQHSSSIHSKFGSEQPMREMSPQDNMMWGLEQQLRRRHPQLNPPSPNNPNVQLHVISHAPPPHPTH